MNKLTVFLFVLGCWILLFHNVCSQSPVANKNQTDTTSSDYKCIIYITEWPEYPGGRVAMKQFIADHLVYPEFALKENIEGRVVIGCTIESDGSLSDIRVLH